MLEDEKKEVLNFWWVFAIFNCYNPFKMWWLKFSLLIAITVSVTWLIVWLDSSFRKRLKSDPSAGPERGLFRGIVYFILNLRDIF